MLEPPRHVKAVSNVGVGPSFPLIENKNVTPDMTFTKQNVISSWTNGQFLTQSNKMVSTGLLVHKQFHNIIINFSKSLQPFPPFFQISG